MTIKFSRSAAFELSPVFQRREWREKALVAAATVE